MTNRRIVIAWALSVLADPLAGRKASAQGAMTKITAYAFSFPALAGGEIRLSDYEGHPMLVVNTASLCGFTPQYAGLQQLWSEFHDRGLTIIGVPSNDFGAQEPGGASEIAETAQHHYGVTFPMAAKTSAAPMPIPSTNGPQSRGRAMFRAGTSANSSSVAMATSRRSLPNQSNHLIRG
jgi:glutathione peroxidase